MYYAKNEAGNTICIEDSIPDHRYTCPVCGGEMRRKMGKIKQHHFAHITAECDPWYSENKGPWHRKMQSLFPAECQEVAKEMDGERHIADVYIPTYESAVIIEFQHSPISPEEYEARNDFWSYFGTVIWVFDLSEKDVRQIPKHPGMYKWYRPSPALKERADGNTYTWYFIKPALKTYYGGGAIHNGHEVPFPFFILDDEPLNTFVDRNERLNWSLMFQPWEMKFLGSISEGSILQTTTQCDSYEDFMHEVYKFWQKICVTELNDCKREDGFTCWIKYKNLQSYAQHASAWCSIAREPSSQDTLVQIYLEEEAQIRSLNIPRTIWNNCTTDIARLFSTQNLQITQKELHSVSA